MRREARGGAAYAQAVTYPIAHAYAKAATYPISPSRAGRVRAPALLN